MPVSKSLDTETQLQETASRHGLRSSLFRRYDSLMRRFLVSAFFAKAAVNSLACSSSAPYSGSGTPPKDAGPGDFYVSGALILEGTPGVISAEKSRMGIFSVCVDRWLHGAGPKELEVSGFHEYVKHNASCQPGGRNLVLGKRHILVLDAQMAGVQGKAYSQSLVDGLRVIQLAWQIEF